METPSSPKPGKSSTFSSDSDSTSLEVIHTSDEDDDSIGDSAEFSQSLLNFRSLNFSPILKIKSADKVTLPDPSAPTYLNLAQYSKAVTSPSKSPRKDLQLDKNRIKGIQKNLDKTARNPPQVKQDDASGSKTVATASSWSKAKPNDPGKSTGQYYPMPGRRFLAHQMPVFRPRKEAPNALNIMENIQGPLAGLRVAMREGKRVKVWTRNDKGFRGYVTGFIEAFDKHWNLALRDVDETFQRKRRIKYPISPISAVNKAVSGDKEKVKIDRRSLSSRVTRSSKRNKKVPEEPLTPLLDSTEDLLAICRVGLANLRLEEGNPPPPPTTSAMNLLKGQEGATKSAKRKNGLKIFKAPCKDANGFLILAQTKKVEIVERHLGQLFLMGNDVVFIETNWMR